MKKNIAFIAGGNSSEREIALQSAAMTAAAIDKQKYDVWIIDLHHNLWTYTAADGKTCQLDRNDFSLTLDGRKICFDYAFIMIHGTPGEDGRIEGYLDMVGVPYSTSGMVASTITFDKKSCKRAVTDTGVKMARDIFVTQTDSVDPDEVVAKLGLPLFVKPNASGSSFGVTKVSSREQIEGAVAEAFKESDAVLIEECIVGREIACGVLITRNEEILLPVTEIVAKNEFFDYESKYTAGKSDEITPADLPSETVDELHHFTRAIYRACRCKGVARVDYIVTADGEPFFIEINTIPGMSGGSIVPKQVAAAGIKMSDFIDKIIDDTIQP